MEVLLLQRKLSPAMERAACETEEGASERERERERQRQRGKGGGI